MSDHHGWTCRECNKPVAGPYALCTNCHLKPTRGPASPFYSSPHLPETHKGLGFMSAISGNDHKEPPKPRADLTFYTSQGKETKLSEASKEELIILVLKLTNSDCVISGPLNQLATYFHARSKNAGWWPEHTEQLRAVKIALIHSEVSEALEGIRKDTQDAHLPHRKSVEVEFCDTLIRVFDLAGEMKLDLDGAIWEKDAYNGERLDHKKENREALGGKKF